MYSKFLNFVGIGLIAFTMSFSAIAEEGESAIAQPALGLAPAPLVVMDPVDQVVPDTCRFNYPQAGLDYQLEGEVGAQLEVGADGKLVSASIIKSSGWRDLDRASLNQLWRCKFRPPVQDGKQVYSGIIAKWIWALDPTTPRVPPALIPDSCPQSTEFAFYSMKASAEKVPAQPSVDPNAARIIRLLFQVDPNGTPFHIVVDRWIKNKKINAPAIDFLGHCRFPPTIIEGKPVQSAGNLWLIWNGEEN
ncbi:energy transducer TonB [Collimonas sp.]|jgi:TonB family protein|uniref:energy transducer TonB n=1 Tax=Collimonas sp. TaxID=1963772 RepID=UPI002CCE99A4|nr:energy transducer TonB [Collimonas sp.]HWW07531.1 energy transducer TonB [Collimonas sp.]